MHKFEQFSFLKNMGIRTCFAQACEAYELCIAVGPRCILYARPVHVVDRYLGALQHPFIRLSTHQLLED